MWLMSALTDRVSIGVWGEKRVKKSNQVGASVSQNLSVFATGHINS